MDAKNKPLVTPKLQQALFVCTDSKMFIQEGFFTENPSREWQDTLVARVVFATGILDSEGKPKLESSFREFAHGEVVLGLGTKIHVYFETGPADPAKIPTTKEG